MSADKKSSLVQIAQAVLDEATQSVKVRLDNQRVQIHVELDKDEDSVTVHQATEVVDDVITEIPWVVKHITEPVATKIKQDEQLVKLEAVRVATVDAKDATIEAKDATIEAKDATLAIKDKVSTEAKQDSQIIELQAIKGHVDQVESKLDNLIAELFALNTKSARLDAVHTSHFDYESTNVTNASWVELTTVPASVEVREIAIFDSSGEVVEVGVVQNAVDNPTTVKIFIFPGGNQPMPITLAAGDILKIRAKSNILSAGACIINFYGVSTL